MSNTGGASAAEFALVLPLLLILLFTIISGGRFLWELNEAEKATQVGARFAVVTNAIDSDLADFTYVGYDNGGTFLTQGDRIPSAAFGSVKCTNSACSCEVEPCPGDETFDQDAFERIVDRMKLMKPDIGYANVEVEYHSSGLGFAGDPNGLDVSPMVTVRLKDLQFQFFHGQDWSTFSLPSSATTLTAEDSAGTVSN